MTTDLPDAAADLSVRFAPAAGDLAGAAAAWLSSLTGERRASRHTLEAYARDVRQLFGFLAEHHGRAPDLAAFADLSATDLRAFLARRRREGAGSRSLLRQLAGLRAFARFLERAGHAKVTALSAVRSPKLPRSLPKPLTLEGARRVTEPESRAGETRAPWILARDAAVLGLLYGCGLRISEALSLTRRDAPTGERDSITVLGKGRKQRGVPVIAPVRRGVDAYLALCPYTLPLDGPLFVGQRGGPLAPRIIQLAVERMRGARGEAEGATHPLDGELDDPRRERTAACVAAFVRNAPPRPRRRSAHHPGTARPCLAVDDAGLHRRRRRTAARGLPARSSPQIAGRQKADGPALEIGQRRGA